MIIFLYGPDSYRRREKLKKIVSDYKKKHSGLSIHNFDLADSAEIQPFNDFLNSNSLFDSFKLGIISGGEKLEGAEEKEFRKSLKDILQNQTTTLIILFDKNPVKEYKFLLEKPAIFEEFEILGPEVFSRFIQKEEEKRGLKLDKKSRDLLMSAYAGDSWGLVNELDKLSLSDGKNITSILENDLDIPLSENIFDITGDMRNSKNISFRLSLLEELLSKNNDSAKIFNIIAVSPYADFEWKKKAADCDAAVKSGKLEYEEALLDLLIYQSG